MPRASSLARNERAAPWAWDCLARRHVQSPPRVLFQPAMQLQATPRVFIARPLCHTPGLSLDEADVEPTDEIHPILEKMEHAKFYRLTELYEMTYGKPFYVDLQENDDKKTLWLFLTKVMNLRTQLEVIVIVDRLRTGRRKGEEEAEVNVSGHIVLGGPVIYYSRK